MSVSDRIGTGDKALRINLDALRYGTFAEIGAGQEVARWFFRVGGAAGTVAKTMSAYDMKVSDAIYGEAKRYVSRERLLEMLDHEYTLLLERLAESRGDKTCFFVFADTVATRSFKGDNEAHGWIGLRFQHRPGAPPSQTILHVALGDPTAQRQQESLGVLGVNLLSAAFYPHPERRENLKALQDDLTVDSIEIDVLEVSGPAFGAVPGAEEIGVDLIAAGLARAVVVDENGRLEQPSGVLRKRGLLLHRAPWGDQPGLDAMLRFGAARLIADRAGGERGPLGLAEIDLPLDGPVDVGGVAARVAGLRRPGCAVMLSAYREGHWLVSFLRGRSTGTIALLIGLDALVHMFHQGGATASGGVLEAVGRMMLPDTRLYVFSLPADTLRSRLKALGVPPEFCAVEGKGKVAVTDIRLASPVGRLLEYLIESGWVCAAEA